MIDERLRRALVAHGAVRGDHALLVDRDAGQRSRLRAGGQDDRAGLERLGAARALHLHARSRLQRAPPGNERDLVLPEQELDALGHPVGDAPASLHRLGVVRLEPGESDAELRGAAGRGGRPPRCGAAPWWGCSPSSGRRRPGGRPRRPRPRDRAGRTGSPPRSRPGRCRPPTTSNLWAGHAR